MNQSSHQTSAVVTLPPGNLRAAFTSITECSGWGRAEGRCCGKSVNWKLSEDALCPELGLPPAPGARRPIWEVRPSRILSSSILGARSRAERSQPDSRDLQSELCSSRAGWVPVRPGPRLPTRSRGSVLPAGQEGEQGQNSRTRAVPKPLKS